MTNKVSKKSVTATAATAKDQDLKRVSFLTINGTIFTGVSIKPISVYTWVVYIPVSLTLFSYLLKNSISFNKESLNGVDCYRFRLDSKKVDKITF